MFGVMVITKVQKACKGFITTKRNRSNEFSGFIALASRLNKQLVQNNPQHCSPFHPHRNVLTALLFIARAFISGGFQAAYVYTPEVRRSALSPQNV